MTKQSRSADDGGYQSHVRVGTYNGHDALIKRILHPGIPGLRRLEKWVLDREARALQRLQEVPWVPNFYGYPTRYSLAMEVREGQTLREVDPQELPDVFFEELAEAVEAIHREGVVHSDLKKKENILVTPHDRPVLIDFGTAFRRESRGGGLTRFLYDQFKRIDRNAVAKLKQRYRPGLLTDQDRWRLDHPVLLERLSRFGNRYILFRR